MGLAVQEVERYSPSPYIQHLQHVSSCRGRVALPQYEGGGTIRPSAAGASENRIGLDPDRDSEAAYAGCGLQILGAGCDSVPSRRRPVVTWDRRYLWLSPAVTRGFLERYVCQGDQ